LQQLTDSQARASTAHSAELQQRAEDLQQANAAAQAARDKLAEEILESKRVSIPVRCGKSSQLQHVLTRFDSPVAYAGGHATAS